MAGIFEVDGVPVYALDGDSRQTSARLTFAVGLVDEPLWARGVLHLIEHLAMATAHDTPIEVNASVDMEVTDFYASGTPARVATFLREVCLGLATLPVDRLEIEKSVLDAEDSWGAHPVAATLFSQRYGARGPGVVAYRGAGHQNVDAQTVQEFADRWFTSGNALLYLRGSVPEGLSLPLREGTPPPHRRPTEVVADSPTLIASDLPDIGLLLRMPGLDSAMMGFHTREILRRRIESETRHRAGHSYSVQLTDAYAPDGSDDLVVVVDAAEGKELAVARIVIDAVHDLAQNGPTEAELARVIETILENWEGQDEDVAAAARQRLHELWGFQVGAYDLEAMRSVTVDDVRRVFAGALPAVVFCVPETIADDVATATMPISAGCPTVPAPLIGATYRPPLAARAFGRDARRSQLVHGDAGLSLTDWRGEHHVIPWDGIEGVMTVGDERAYVYGTNGCVIPVGKLFKGSERVLRQVLDSVDPSRVFPADAATREAILG